MALQSNSSQSDHQLTGAGDDEAASRNYLSRKKPKRPPMTSSSDFESRHSTTPAIVCNLSASQTARITQQFDHSLIAWIAGKDIHPCQLKGRLRYHLRLTEDFNVFELDLGYFVLQFSETDYLALNDLPVPWSIPNLCIHAFPWTPDFKPSEAINSSVNVWIRLRELSIEYYDDEILQQIAKAIGGDLMKIDPVTKNRTKCKFARICIRVNLCDPRPSMIKLGRIQLEIEYEGFGLLCPKCRLLGDLKHDCLRLSNPSDSSGFDIPHRGKPHHHQRTRPFKDPGSSSSSKQPLIPSESSPASAYGSRFQVLEKDPLLDLQLNDYPRLLIGECQKADSSIRINSLDVPVKAESTAKQKGKCGISVPVQTLPNLPKESTTITIKAPELKRVAPPVVQDQFKAVKSSKPTMITDHYEQPQTQPSSSTTRARIPSLKPCPASEASLKFHSAAIQCSTKEKEITDTPSKEINVDSCPTVYTVDSKKTKSLKMTASMSNQNQYAIEFVPTARGGDKGGVSSDSEAVSGSESCSKKMLCWKFHGTDNAKLTRALKDLIQLHEPSILLIFGTKISGADADQVVQELTLGGSYGSRKLDGYNGGVWLLLTRQDVQIEVNSYSRQHVSASVYFHTTKTNAPVFSLLDVDTATSSEPWGSTFFYTSTNWMGDTLTYC